MQLQPASFVSYSQSVSENDSMGAAVRVMSLMIRDHICLPDGGILEAISTARENRCTAIISHRTRVPWSQAL